jgi:trans-aconitate methyltransferase
MDYFDNEKNVNHYIKMMAGENNDYIINEVFLNLTHKKRLLELGLGAGKDFDILKKEFDIVGSDKSQHFLDAYAKQDPSATLVKLDAVKMDIDMTFDYIYSNKVLIHLTDEKLATSFENQAKVLDSGGQLFHSFWRGDDDATYDGLYFNYQTQASILSLCEKWYDVIKYHAYRELVVDDSFYVILQKR